MTEQTDESDQTESTRVECPQCGSLDGTPIAWGYPGAGTFEAADRGEVVLGGCVVSADDPTHSCTSCGYSWVHPDATRDPRSVLREPDYAAAMPIPEETPPGRDPELMEHTVELLDLHVVPHLQKAQAGRLHALQHGTGSQPVHESCE